MRTIEEIASFLKTGKTPPSRESKYFNGDINWYTPGDLDKLKYLKKSNRTITKIAISEKKAVIFPKNTLLIGCIGNIGKLGITSEECSSNQQLTGLFPKENVDVNYLFFWFRGNQKVLIAHSNNAVVPILNNRILSSIKIPLPPLAEQQQIVAILDEADRLRQLNQALLDQYDHLAQALFLDMFGDPVLNPKGWEIKTIDDISSLVTKGSSPKWQGYGYIESGVRFITSENVRLGFIDIKKDKFVAKEFHEKLSRSKLKKHDLLVNLVGASIGRGALVSSNILPANINQAVAKIELDTSKINPSFILNLIITPRMQDRLIGNKVEGARANISLRNVRELKLILPPLALQTEFAKRIEIIEAQKAQAQVALSESEDLFNALLQRAFKGELTS